MKEASPWIVLNDQGDYYQKEPKIEKIGWHVSFADSWSSSQKILDLKKKKKDCMAHRTIDTIQLVLS